MDLLQLMWQTTCWRGALLLWISCSFCQSYCWSSWSNCIQQTVTLAQDHLFKHLKQSNLIWQYQCRLTVMPLKLTSGWWGIGPIPWWCCHTSECLLSSCLRMHKSVFPSSPASPEACKTWHQNRMSNFWFEYRPFKQSEMEKQGRQLSSQQIWATGWSKGKLYMH